MDSHPSNQRTVDKTKPKGRWAFDANVAACFDDMLARSIPQYRVMRRTVTNIGRRFVRPQTDIVDLGCSRGEALAPFVRAFPSCNCWGIEVSAPMLEAAQKRFEREISMGSVKILDLDLTAGLPAVHATLILAVLTIQFTPIEYRPHILADVYRRLLPGGAFLMVEKVLGGSALTDQVMVEEYYALKSRNGYSQADIDRKRKALAGVLVPVTAQMNEEFLRGAGFETVECVWRWCNFAGWLAVRRAD